MSYFTRSEFECSCGCGFDTVDFELMEVLNELRGHFDEPVSVTSGARCILHNAEVGGGKTSQHLRGRAADIVVKNYTPEEVWTYLMEAYPDKYGIGKYNTFTHIDTRPTKGRWGSL